MFVERRKKGKKIKYYLVHSYRIGDKVKRISQYLGSDLSENELTKLKKRAEQLILNQVKEKSIFEFELSKKEIEEFRKFEKPIKIEHLKNINWQRFTENFTYNTNAIEGSSVSYSEVKDIIEKKKLPEDDDGIETLGVAKAVNYIRKTKEKLSINLIKKLHYLCFKETKSFAGKLRNVEVVIQDGYGNIIHQGAPSKDVGKLLRKLFAWYNKHKNKYPPLLLAAYGSPRRKSMIRS